MAIYAQDQWALRRLTLNLGVRWDNYNGQIDAQDAAAGTYVPARHFDKIQGPNWKDLSPRLGMAWDLFGNGKTAAKTSFSRYVTVETWNFMRSMNPMIAGPGQSDVRTWADRNNDRIPQFDELGPSTNLNFGRPVFTVRPDPALLEGWGVRNHNWEYSASLQHQVLPGLSASVAYYRRWFGNLTWTNNRAVQQSDYTPFTIVRPLDDARITLFNLAPAKRGVIDNVVELAPDDTQVFDGVDVVMTGRFGEGGFVSGSASMGRTATKRCTAFDPNTQIFCDARPPFMGQNVYKV
ncbi:MAG: hypothetical protein Q7R41_20585, partial [Phycisphaerales bacterium]|nr:hypothetical protein [Phycisphaerales bacterium]